MNRDVADKKGLIGRIIIVALIVGVIGGFTSPDPMAYIKGLTFGTIFSIIKLQLMEKTINRAVTMPPKNANNFAVLHYVLRYILTGVVLFVAALEPSIDLIGVMIGLLSIKISAFSFIYINKLTERRER